MGSLLFQPLVLTQSLLLAALLESQLGALLLLLILQGALACLLFEAGWARECGPLQIKLAAGPCLLALQTFGLRLLAALQLLLLAHLLLYPRLCMCRAVRHRKMLRRPGLIGCDGRRCHGGQEKTEGGCRQ
ncbi:hypothetical protein SALB1_1340 [Salinisphaera sp. LB1]|nr:hypothetical protein SALB1_1340 [Salinisphaera sp. LB1]